MRVLVLYTYDCVGCGKCVSKCQHAVLRLVDNGNCRFASISDRNKCTGCGKCVDVCKERALELRIMNEIEKPNGKYFSAYV